ARHGRELRVPGVTLRVTDRDLQHHGLSDPGEGRAELEGHIHAREERRAGKGKEEAPEGEEAPSFTRPRFFDSSHQSLSTVMLDGAEKIFPSSSRRFRSISSSFSLASLGVKAYWLFSPFFLSSFFCF